MKKWVGNSDGYKLLDCNKEIAKMLPNDEDIYILTKLDTGSTSKFDFYGLLSLGINDDNKDEVEYKDHETIRTYNLAVHFAKRIEDIFAVMDEQLKETNR